MGFIKKWSHCRFESTFPRLSSLRSRSYCDYKEDDAIPKQLAWFPLEHTCKKSSCWYSRLFPEITKTEPLEPNRSPCCINIWVGLTHLRRGLKSMYCVQYLQVIILLPDHGHASLTAWYITERNYSSWQVLLAVYPRWDHFSTFCLKTRTYLPKGKNKDLLTTPCHLNPLLASQLDNQHFRNLCFA